ncbi:MAG: tryptophan-rich sensory protein [Rhizobiaceae bacterium]|jgi:tryptophan-rich sensory protein|nr:tryptophan-rich sensory protein [Rhizobiaceae bacterium]
MSDAIHRPTPSPASTRDYALLAGFILVVFGIGSAIGIFFAPGGWYAALEKPAFNPPDWLFGPVWTILYIMIAVAGWRTVRADKAGLQTTLWFAQLGFNFLWSPVFFGLHLMWVAAFVAAGMLMTSLAFALTARRNGDTVSALLFVPYLAWISFALLLNITLAAMNAG